MLGWTDVVVARAMKKIGVERTRLLNCRSSEGSSDLDICCGPGRATKALALVASKHMTMFFSIASNFLSSGLRGGACVERGSI